jgi:hypothetical protein
MNKAKFLELLKLPSRGNFNQSIHEYIKQELTSLNITFSIFEKTSIYNIDAPNLPLFVAHTDTVRSILDDKNAATCIGEYIHEGLTIIANKGILGGDDMCGVHIILDMLREGKKINFLFSDNEETVFNASSKFFMREFSEKLSTLPYGIILDRKGNTDIICSHNRYGHIDFENDLSEIGEQFGYYPEIGMCSDADFIRNVMSCANLGVGYYKAHTPKEFVVWEHMENTYNYSIAILETLHKRYPVHPSILTRYFENSIIENTLQLIEQSGVLGYR